ncbi:hypothetical protein SAMN05444166_6521 [Singulisphaera sp. GP187]|uniref:hypothetical protein n=1 Tax=Singulisphaera sp. GP187 TaxID=1882752 RepID=UPI00092C8862|nr:hypothetical protein [Singulisphaera sp. GP187]SIO60783.1 hypothetical protein SAMN05444166_6521 [Singulisphaera sp. GP187]
MGVGDPQFDAANARDYRQPVVRFSAIGEAWTLVQAEWFTWALTMLVVLAGNSLVSKLADSLFHLGHNGGLVGFRWPMPREEMAVQVVLAALINGFFVGGMFRMACRQIRGMRIQVSDLFSVVDVLNELAMGAILCAVIVALVSFVCFVIPGLILHGLFMFTIPLIVDGRLTAIAAIQRSWNALKSQWLLATLFHAVTSFLSGIGTCFFCIGILLTGPIYVLSIAILYRDFFLAKGVAFDSKPAPPYSDF